LATLRLVVFLRRRGLSAQEAAEILGVSRATICRWCKRLLRSSMTES
jgi:transposase